jgi:NitT/TauT family transport system substrate-binding protein
MSTPQQASIPALLERDAMRGMIPSGVRGALAALLMTAAFDGPVTAQTPVTIHVAVVPFEGSAEVSYAQQSGAFARAGLDVEIDAMQSTGPIAAAVASNAEDIGFGTIGAIAVAHVHKIPFVFVAPALLVTAEAESGALVVARDAPIHTAADLSGKTVAIPGLATLNDYAVRAWIDRDGGNSTAVKFVEVAFPAMGAMLAAGRVDAVSLSEPFLSDVKRTARILVNPDPAVARAFIGSGYFTTAQWAQDHPDLVRRFAAVIRETAKAANANPAATVAQLSAFTKIPAATITQMVRSRFSEEFTAPLMQPLIDVSAHYGGFAAFPAGELIYQPPG